MRLAGGIDENRLSGREYGRHQGVLGRHHARLVEEDVLPAQGAAAHLVASSDLYSGTELGEGVDVWVEAPAPDHVTAGRRRADAAEPSEQRPGQQEGCAHPAAQVVVELALRQVRGVNVNIVRARPVSLRAEVVEELDHRLDVRD